MKCKLCGGDHTKLTYKGLIRNGGLGNYTKAPVNIWKCEKCNVIWHDTVIDDTRQYYESEEYRNSLEGNSEIDTFYKLHDKETLNKFLYTGTEIFRKKVVADIGCGAGAFLDFLTGVAKTIIAVEPSNTYRQAMELKGFKTYAYTSGAKESWRNKVDVITSFDVIEHVENPKEFMKDVYELLSVNGSAVIGTPTETPVMRQLLGEIYEKKLLFSTQHLWVFSESNLKMIAKEAGFQRMEVKYFQRYGMGNLLGWLREKEPCSDIEAEFITHTLDSVWKSECNVNGFSDYIVIYLYK